MQGEDPKKSGGDLLSELFDLDESDAGSERTEVLSRDQKDLGEVLQEKLSAPATNDEATLLETDLSKLEDLPSPSQKSFQLDEKLFDQVLEEDPLPSEKISFFDQILDDQKSAPSASSEDEDATLEATQMLNASDAPLAESVSRRPFEREDATITLDKPEDATVDMPAPKADAIDDALASFEKDFAPEEDETPVDTPRQPSEFSSEPRIPDLANPPAADDFKDVFESKPLIAPDVDLAKKSFKRKKLLTAVKWAAGLVIVVGGFGWGSLQLTSDAGLFGYVFENGTFSVAYQAPDESALQEFQKLFSEAREARLNDDVSKIEGLLPQLEAVLRRDVRNIEAAQTIVLHLSHLIAWNGPGSAWAQQLDRAIQRVSEIATRLNVPAGSVAMARAEAIRLMAVGSTGAAVKSLESLFEQIPAEDIESSVLVGELLISTGDEARAETWLKRIEKDRSRRARFVSAVARKDLAALQALGVEGHLPSRVEVFVRSKPTNEELPRRLEDAQQLLEEVKSFPSLWLKVSVYAGDLYVRLGQGDKAREIWSAVVQKYPRAVEVWMKLAVSYQEDALWNEALEAFKAIEKNQGLRLEFATEYVALLRRRGLWVDASRVVEGALKAYPKSADLFYQKGQIELKLYQEELAKQSFLKSVENDKNFEPAWIGLSEISLRRRDWQEAESYLKKIPESSDQYPRAIFALGRIQEERGARTKALETFLRVIDRDPKFEEAYWSAARILLDFERSEDAEDLIQRGLKSSPKSPLLQVAMGRVQHFSRNYEDAKQTLMAVVEKNENLLEAHYALIETLIELKDFTKANESVAKLNLREVRDPTFQFVRAKLIQREIQAGRYSGSPEMAARYIASAIKDQPTNPEFRVLAARLNLGLQERVTAMEHIQAALNVDPHYSPALMVLGEYRLEGGEYEKAAEAFQEAAKHTRFRGPIYRKLADSFKAAGKTDLAISYYEKVTSAGGASPEAYLELGKLYSDENRHVAAIRTLKRALQLNPRLAEAFYFLGFVQKEVGESGAAIKSFEAFLDLEPAATESAQVRDEIFFLKRNAQAN